MGYVQAFRAIIAEVSARLDADRGRQPGEDPVEEAVPF